MASTVFADQPTWVIADVYNHFWSLRDPRTEGWGGIADAKLVLPLLVGYLYFAKVGGPRWMKDRKPFDLRMTMLAYNVLTALANAYFVVRGVEVAYMSGHYSLFCRGIQYDAPEADTSILRLTWWYCFVRVADLLDTVFFVLRKKDSHITLLHVLHHFLVVLSGWFYMNFGADGQPFFMVTVNAMAHVIMYFYYFLAALGPPVQKYLRWKRYLTGLQITQFVVTMAQCEITPLYDCGYPRALAVIGLSQCHLGLLLFVNFYIKNYVKRKARGGECDAKDKSD
ncbi:hypothetical protein V5799_031314 [Amblyomma americanum]|uniref:Elongation of very long chain fatty acids protein n=1 Tax=Amblyomma americanum TaxID=6943 RepID=A0AAQ4EKN8_AMBAM